MQGEWDIGWEIITITFILFGDSKQWSFGDSKQWKRSWSLEPVTRSQQTWIVTQLPPLIKALCISAMFDSSSAEKPGQKSEPISVTAASCGTRACIYMLLSLLGFTWCLNTICVLLLRKIFWKTYQSMHMNEIYIEMFLSKQFINIYTLYTEEIINLVYAEPWAPYMLPKLGNILIIGFMLTSSTYWNTNVCQSVAKLGNLPSVHMHVCRKTFRLAILCWGEQNCYSTTLFSNFESVMI